MCQWKYECCICTSAPFNLTCNDVARLIHTIALFKILSLGQNKYTSYAQDCEKQDTQHPEELDHTPVQAGTAFMDIAIFRDIKKFKLFSALILGCYRYVQVVKVTKVMMRVWS